MTTRETGAAEQPRAGVHAKLIDKVGVSLEAYIGEARMTVGELGALKEGSVVGLDSPLGQAVELRLNGDPVARGEIVAVGDRFGVRIVELSQ